MIRGGASHPGFRTDAGNISSLSSPAPPAHLIIVGGPRPLAATAKICDFQVTVLDDRVLYATPTRFPTADRVIAGPFVAELRNLRQGRPTFDDDTYIVLVTGAHTTSPSLVSLAYIG